jgi:hypothetical protein
MPSGGRCGCQRAKPSPIPATKGRAGGKLPPGNGASRSPPAQSLRGLPEGGDEPGIGVVEGLADDLGRRMDERRRRTGEGGRTIERVLRQDRGDSRHGQAFVAPRKGRLGFDGLHQGRDALSIDLGRQVSPAGLLGDGPRRQGPAGAYGRVTMR